VSTGEIASPVREVVQQDGRIRLQYFSDTDTLYIEFRAAAVAETHDLDENTLLELDGEGQICGITVEHARDRAELPKFSFEQAT